MPMTKKISRKTNCGIYQRGGTYYFENGDYYIGIYNEENFLMKMELFFILMEILNMMEHF